MYETSDADIYGIAFTDFYCKDLKVNEIKINNKEVQVPEGTRIIDACRDNGYKIPSLCFLKDINEIGACRNLRC